ncbi:aspartate kinase [Mariprofundus ferrinatatus]|uniref:Aspartokinase n=1 Tax=Mariprofundus ferrinatatus TaxID=1921087 RepID=A0A2K8L1Q7_9PROT|nr:aspartate kinase [Mariprofundus ferrinatatus]ATX81217.1 aspartate kinase [Mariprofundus ferrinatatus]
MRIVQKYGGTSVGTLERIRKTADIVQGELERGNQVAVVVSAMSGETNRLLALAFEVSDAPATRELDAMVATGEQVSAALLAMELQTRGIKAYSFNGAQAGFKTDSSFVRARITDVQSDHLIERMERFEVPVVTGFQGIDASGNITTLGRGGSDTSAVALAIAVKADVCDIYTDVDGIYTTDPRIVSRAQKMDQISFEEMLEFASLGAKVLQTRSVELAMRYNMPIHLRSSFDLVPGTMVTTEDEKMERAAISGVAYNRDEAKITLKEIPDHPGIASSVFGPVAEAGINVDVIVQNVSEKGHTDITFTVPRSDYAQTMKIMAGISKDIGASDLKGDNTVAKVSVIGVGMRSHAGVAQKMFQVLAAEGVNIQMITTSEIKITVVIDEKYVELAVRALHGAFGLDREQAAT